MRRPAGEKLSTIYLIRLIHGMITLFFLVCIAYIYYAAVTDRASLFAYAAVAMILLEGFVVILNKGICPLGTVHRKFGDNKTFFELFLPKSVADRAVPFLGCVAVIGILWFFL